MNFRSWYIVLLGIVLQGGLGLLFISSAEDSGDWGGVVGLVLGIIIVLFTLALGLIPLLLLLFRKTRIFGAIVSIIFGIIGLSTQLGLILGPFLLIAGAIALWRKI